MIIPQDEHLARVMESATCALERAGITGDDLLAGLEEARDEVVTERYGEDYFDRLRTIGADYRDCAPTMGQLTLRALKRLHLDASCGCNELRSATLSDLLKDR